jgi:hypothetical protein
VVGEATRRRDLKVLGVICSVTIQVIKYKKLEV